MIRALDLVQGKAGIPEGFAVAIGKTLDLSAGTAVYFSYEVEMDYWLHLREIRAKWAQPTGAGVGVSIPAIEIFRDLGDRAYQQGNLGVNAIDLRTLTSPGEFLASGVSVNTPYMKINVRPAVPLEMWFPPGSIMKIKVTGFTPNDPATMDIAAIGRYVLRPGVG